MHAAHADLADVARVVERADLQHQAAVGVVVAHGHVLDDGVEDRAHVADLSQLLNVVGFAREAVESRSVDDGEVELLFGGAELVEKVERLIEHPVRARARTVDLVDDDDRLEALRECLARHEARLRHGAFHGVNEKQHAVDHREHALDFAAEVRMPRRVDDVDVHALVFDGAVLGENRDAAFAFDGVRIHHALFDLLVGTEGARALQQTVDEGGLAVVDVRNDRDVANGSSHSV